MTEKNKSHILLKIFASIFLILFIFFLYSRYINTEGLKIKEIPIIDKSLPNDYNGLKIAHFSDLHYGLTTNEEKLKKVVKELNKLNADIVIFTGDLFEDKNISEENITFLTNYFKEIKAKLFKFACIGDYDEKYLNTYKSIIENSNFILLDNTKKLVYNNSKTPLNFIGVTNTTDITDLFSKDYYNITITHKPDNIEKINSNLVFAGHSLGGQLRLPFIGGLRKKEGAKCYIDEYYQVGSSLLYISNGIGTEDYPLRSFNTPSLTLYRLYNN